jgi:hypothetical protein
MQETHTGQKTRSIGDLRPAHKTKQKSPLLTGKIRIQRHTLKTLVDQITESNGSEIKANLAAWIHGTDARPISERGVISSVCLQESLIRSL